MSKKRLNVKSVAVAVAAAAVLLAVSVAGCSGGQTKTDGGAAAVSGETSENGLRISVARDMISFNGKAIVSVNDVKALPDRGDGMFINELADELKAARESDATQGKMAVWLEKEVEYNVLYKIMAICARSGYTGFDVTVALNENETISVVDIAPLKQLSQCAPQQGLMISAGTMTPGNAGANTAFAECIDLFANLSDTMVTVTSTPGGFSPGISFKDSDIQSALNEFTDNLKSIRERFPNAKDTDYAVIAPAGHLHSDKAVKFMDAARKAGFRNIAVAMAR